MRTKDKEYLGDGVYTEQDEFENVVLTTENGLLTTNRIVLEPQVLQALLDFLDIVPEKGTLT